MGLLIRSLGKNKRNLSKYLEIVVDFIIQGKLIAFPTNSVYGIGGDPQDLELIDRVYDIKFREKSKGLLLLVADLEEAKKIAEFNEVAEKLADFFWPGQLTLILKRKEPNIIPLEATAFQETIGLRIPENDIILKILKSLKDKGHFGGIIGTSANYSGEPPSISGAEVAKKFLGHIDLIIDAGKTDSKMPTTIVDCSKGEIKLLRIGKISEKEVRNSLSVKENQKNNGVINEEL